MKTNNEHSNFKNFRNYYTGNMSSEEKVDFENQLEEDSFAKEAYEGFLLLENDFARISAIENTNMVLKNKFGIDSNSNTLPLKYILSIAATLVLFLGSYFLIQSDLFSENQNLADNHQKEVTISDIVKEESVKLEVIDSFVEYDTIESVDESENERILQNEVAVTNVVIEKPATEKATKPAAVQVKEPEQLSGLASDKKKPIKEKSISTEEVFTEEQPQPQIQKAYDKNEQLSNTVYADDSEVLEPEIAKNISEYKKGIIAYNKSEYPKAIKHFNSSITENKSLSGSNYYIAMSYFNQDKSQKAIKYFDITINKGSTFTDNAMWYKSLTLLNKGEKAEAKTLLNQIVTSNSSFKNAAIKKLESLD